MKDLISIIIPVYNAECYLGECINSIIEQTYSNLEILLIDDGSIDGSGQICDEFASKDERIKVVHKENGGVSSARNKGLDLAKGKYIAFVDADDFVDKNYISIMYKKCIETQSDLTFCRFAKYINGLKVPVQEDIPVFLCVDIYSEEFVDFFCRFFDYKKNIFGSSCRFLFKSQLMLDKRFDPSIKVSEDLLFLLSIILEAKCLASVKDCLYFYRQVGDSASHSYKTNYLNSQLALYMGLEKIYSLFNFEKQKKLFQTYNCSLCHYVLSNEIKFKSTARKVRVQAVRDSVLYQHLRLKYGLRIPGVLFKLKFLVTWFLVKTRLV